MNSIVNAPHLSDDQIDDALIGDLAAGCGGHLAGCDECQLRLSRAQAPIASFNAVSLAWSERRSATLPQRPGQSARTAGIPRAAWAASAVAAVAISVAMPLLHRSTDPQTVASYRESVDPTLMASTGPVDNPVAVREEQIARDNQMLENINRELDIPAKSPDQEYGFRTAGQYTSAHAASPSMRN